MSYSHVLSSIVLVLTAPLALASAPPPLSDFGARFAGVAAAHDGQGVTNRMTSPVAEQLALGMVANAAAGTTRDELLGTLGFAGEIKGLNGVHEICQKRLNRAASGDEFMPVVQTANAAWSNSGRPANFFAPEFAGRLRQTYDATLGALDFASPAAADAVNRWADEKSKTLIPSIIDPAALRELDYLLVNITYFAGSWAHEFNAITPARDPRGRLTTFTRADGEVKRVDFIHETDRFKYLATATEQIVELPFVSPADAEYVFYAVLPNDPAVAPSAYMRPESWSRTLTLMNQTEEKLGLVALPKFAFDYTVELTEHAPITAASGLAHLFKPSADLTAMNPAGARLGLIKEVTRIELDEKGVKAAAAVMAGAVAMGLGPQPDFELKFDRPFAFAIAEKRSGTILFLGELQNP